VLDGVKRELLDKIIHAAAHVAHVEEVADVRAPWAGHHLSADVSGTVSGGLSVTKGHDSAGGGPGICDGVGMAKVVDPGSRSFPGLL